MGKKFNLSDAARAVLTEGSKETFDSNISSKKGGQDKPAKLPTSVGYGMKDVGKVGDAPDHAHSDQNPDYTKGVPSATPPGATPPVGKEGMKKLSPQPQETQGRKDIEEPAESDANNYDQIRDRVASKKPKQTMQSNPGATFQSYGEDVEHDEEEVVAEEKEGHEDEKEDKALIKKMMQKDKMKEDIAALVDGENLSEEFVAKATTIFEAAVIARSEEVIAEATQELTEQFDEAIEAIKEELAGKVDDYLNYMVEEWVKENEIAIEKGLRAEIVEDFIDGLRNLFAEHYIDIPEEKVDVVEELTDKVSELEEELNAQIASAIELKKELNEHKKYEAIYTACEGLTQTQVEKMKSLAESVEFTTEDEFATKMSTLKESYFKADVKVADSSALDDEVLIEEEKKPVSSEPMMETYVKTISKSLK